MGRDKALVEVDGSPMAHRVAGALRLAGCSRVVAVGPAYLGVGLEVLADDHPGEGPLGAILTALRAASQRPVIVVACDLAWLDAATIVALLDAAAGDPTADVVVGRTDRIEPLCALWQPSSAAHLEAAFARGERAVHRVLDGLARIEVTVDPMALRNVNSPDDLPE